MKKLSGVLLILVGLVTGIHTVIEPLYHYSTETQPSSPYWGIINIAMIVAIVLGIIYSYRNLKEDKPQTNSCRECPSPSFYFYGFVVIGLLFFHNYFDTITDSYEKDSGAFILLWLIIDVFLAVFSVSLGKSLIQSSD
ncbi:MAG: hypothetical protein OXC03_02030 [Flavobacteriaceae bacterium]|nr:hypothetical protein [Flavobacteriaceae bacterium]